MNVPRCRYIKTNGLICKSPSLNGRVYCYFHRRLNDRNYVYRLHEANQVSLATGASLPITGLEDAESVQLALSVVVNALCVGDLDPQRARAILYGLQLASNNARQIKPNPVDTEDIAFDIENERGYEPAAPAGAQVDIPNGPIHGPKAPDIDPMAEWLRDANSIADSETGELTTNN